MNDFRCSQCKKLLGKIEGKAEIQCPRCKTMNYSLKFQDLITKVPIFTKEEQERMSKEEFDRGTVISTGVQDWRKMFNKGESQR